MYAISVTGVSDSTGLEEKIITSQLDFPYSPFSLAILVIIMAVFIC